MDRSVSRPAAGQADCAPARLSRTDSSNHQGKGCQQQVDQLPVATAQALQLTILQGLSLRTAAEGLESNGHIGAAGPEKARAALPAPAAGGSWAEAPAAIALACLVPGQGQWKALVMLSAAAPRMPTAPSPTAPSPSQLNSNSAAILAPVGTGIIPSMTFVVVCEARTGNDISRCKSR